MEAPLIANTNRFVQLHAWYVSANGKRFFAVVDKIGKHFDENRAGGVVHIYRTTEVKLLETLNPNPVTYGIDDFWDLIDRGKLIEYIPGKTPLTP